MCKGVSALEGIFQSMQVLQPVTGIFYPMEGCYSPWQGCFNPCMGVAPHLVPSLLSTGDSSPP